VDITCLENLDQLLIKQQVEVLEMLTGIETQNKYRIFLKTSPQAPFLLAHEFSSFSARNCLGKRRPFIIHIISPVNTKIVMKLTRSYACCYSTVRIYDGDDKYLGCTKHVFSCCSRKLIGCNAVDEPLFEVLSPWYMSCCD